MIPCIGVCSHSPAPHRPSSTSQGAKAKRESSIQLSHERIHTGRHWTKDHDWVFLCLKIALTCEPVLKDPKYDSTPFIVTTDGCKYGFAEMLTQKHTTILPNGKEVTAVHLIGFVSKRTSSTEEKYRPFILEFSALKHSLDKFGDTIWDYPVEIETDCQVLHDNLLSNKLNTTYAQWRTVS